ncbi:putative cyclase domain-containing protein [Hirsutella rhossiliensis]|uniref:Cyclase domain-containing protein n=1 Tax=Hirsutella rhossiliensis TaxID=111463 RepID=A0A9P8MZR4_9HYPO|nr:putative cyclase domain-containing protein [Hirsutella rhossiliensis]KAH0964277.1 putative cyclase domain-containing protein [Hirsutella rhossiliensis]
MIQENTMAPEHATSSGPAPRSLHDVPYDSLPDKYRVWPGKPGSREEGLGRLVLLTPEIVAEAARRCIQTGVRVSLNWDLTKLDTANFSRSPAQHHIFSLLGGKAFDDVYIFNPQQSTQWDGLRHFSAPFPTEENPAQRLYYGGTTAMEITHRANHRIGIQHWATEGICGRGVLLDYVAYAEKHSITYSPLSQHGIPLRVLKQMACDQGIEFRRGDILFIRTGLTKLWDTQMTPADKVAYSHDPIPRHAGVEGTEEMLRWLWDEGFAAVAGDSISFEVYPPLESYPREDQDDEPGLFLHERLLAGMGVPIGELFDLEELSRTCRGLGRWEFFVTSSPLNMPGGVSSPPNCLALF